MCIHLFQRFKIHPQNYTFPQKQSRNSYKHIPTSEALKHWQPAPLPLLIIHSQPSTAPFSEKNLSPIPPKKRIFAFLNTFMEINMEFELFKYIVETFLDVTGLQLPKKLVPVIIILLFVVVILLIVLCRNLCLTHKWRKKQLDEILKGYEQYTTRQQRWLYIKTWFQSNPPHDLDEPYQAQFEDPRTDSIDFFIKQVLRRDNQKSPYYCILGGSGMGKSTFVVNLVRKYIKKYTEKTLPYPIKLFNCGDYNEKDKLIDRIKSIDIDSQKNTILILDALDENNEAIDNYTFFFDDLLTSIKEFRIVIITCRTQFFERSKDEPDVFPGHEPATKEQRRFKKYYISPLRDEEVNHYINKKYLLRFSAKRKAKAIVNNCKQIMARPLLLSYLDDLLNADIGNSKESIVQIYDILIEKWLEREANFAAADDKKEEYSLSLREFSNELALCLAQPSYNKKEIDNIIERYRANELFKERNLKGRSLLNRNSNDDFKFAHKSFMEFLVAMQLYNQQKMIPLESIDCVSNDMIPLFLSYKLFLCKRDCCDILFLSNSIQIANNRDVDVSYTHPPIPISIYVRCDVSENIAKYIYTFIDNNAELGPRFNTFNIYIDCQYDYSMINIFFPYKIRTSTDKAYVLTVNTELYFHILDKSFSKPIESNCRWIMKESGKYQSLPSLIFYNCNLWDSKLVDFLDRLNNWYSGYYSTIHIISNTPDATTIPPYPSKISPPYIEIHGYSEVGSLSQYVSFPN